MEAETDPATPPKVEDTAIKEQKVDAPADKGLGLDLSFPASQSLICANVESSSSSSDDLAAPKVETTAPPGEIEVRNESKEVKKGKGRLKKLGADNDLLLCNLSDNRMVTLHKFHGQVLVSIRQYYMQDGKLLPSPKGISLTREQWESFVRAVPLIEAALKKFGSFPPKKRR
ncbi:RNA polymerase II transcriptional coactivator KELP-like [Phalaenopsis equestris]|uniref:RNA polymerase II transcriptional coactivator KELP-like n=1 Tax=Phalaenopsis equestris TaxID=78828 RepID=UPI0009E4EE08|nr:RNA polymerase II transcriptional coactivator KELP-like [Phalaenopsis equestris]